MAEESKPASVAALGELHNLLTQSFKQRLEADMEDNIPTDAATLGALAKFLKDNAVTADPASSDELTGLRDKLAAQSQARKNRSNVLALVKDDLAKEA